MGQQNGRRCVSTYEVCLNLSDISMQGGMTLTYDPTTALQNGYVLVLSHPKAWVFWQVDQSCRLSLKGCRPGVAQPVQPPPLFGHILVMKVHGPEQLPQLPYPRDISDPQGLKRGLSE